MKKDKKKKTTEYVNNKDMLEEIILCKKNGNKISDRLGKMFISISNNFASKPNFNGYSYKDELISNGILACCIAFQNFDPEKSNSPFSYFTQVIFHSFLQILNKEKKAQNIRDELLMNADMNPSFGYLERNSDQDSHNIVLDNTKERDE